MASDPRPQRRSPERLGIAQRPGKGSAIAGDETVVAALNKFSTGLTTADLGILDAKVDVSRQKAETVAKEYLPSKGLI